MSPSSTQAHLNWWTTYLDFIAKGYQGSCLRDICRIRKLAQEFGKHGSFGEIKDDGGHGEEDGKLGRGGRAPTMVAAGPTDLHLGSRDLPAAYRDPGSLDPHEPCLSGPRVTVNNTIWQPLVEARKERRYSERRMGTDVEDSVIFWCEAPTCATLSSRFRSGLH